MSAILWYLELSLALPLFGIGMKTDLFKSHGYCWVFQICWHVECSTLTASSFRILNSSAGIPSPALALFIVKLPKAHLISHSRMSCSRRVTTPSWLTRSLSQVKQHNQIKSATNCVWVLWSVKIPNRLKKITFSNSKRWHYSKSLNERGIGSCTSSWPSPNWLLFWVSLLL